MTIAYSKSRILGAQSNQEKDTEQNNMDYDTNAYNCEVRHSQQEFLMPMPKNKDVSAGQRGCSLLNNAN